MIRVDRGPASKPEGFDQRAGAWQTAMGADLAKSPKLTPAKFWTSVRRQVAPDAEVLARLFHDKCAFCESFVRHVAAPQVEHYRPKTTFPALTFSWENWLLSCPACNGRKWAHFPIGPDGKPSLLDPTVDEPDEHLSFTNEHVRGRTDRGRATIDLLDLDRAPLAEQRAWWLSFIHAVAAIVAKDLSVWAEAKPLLLWAASPEGQYSAMVRAELTLTFPRLDLGAARGDRPAEDLRDALASFIETHRRALVGLV